MSLKSGLASGMGSRGSNVPRLVSVCLFTVELYIGRVHPHCDTFTSSSRVTLCSVLKPTGKMMLSFLDSPIDLNWSQFPFVWMESRSKQSLWTQGWSRLTSVGLVNMPIPGAGVTVTPITSYGSSVGERRCPQSKIRREGKFQKEQI